MARNVLVIGLLYAVVSLAGAGVCTGRTWYIRTVESAGPVGSHSSLALDATGFPHISYYGGTSGDLRYANGTTWDIQTVDSAGDAGFYNSLALDASGHPHVSYYCGANGHLRYAVWNGTWWDIRTADSGGDVGEYTSLALDASGHPHMSYYDFDNEDLKYAAWNGSSWDIQTVDSAGRVGEYTSLALDASGYPHIGYYDFTNSALKYAGWDGSDWYIASVASVGLPGNQTSVAVDAGGYPHISYYGGSPNNDLKYAAWTGSSWDIQTVDTGSVGSCCSLALAASGYPHISYRNSRYDDLKYAAWNGTSWDIETVDSADRVGWYTSLALEASGHAHISYYDSTNGQLKYATTHAPAQAWHQLSTTGYYMISFPLIPPSPTPDALLSDDLGDGGYYMWRWEAGGYQSVPTSAPASQTTTLDIQEGYWLLAPASRIDMTGAQAITDQVIRLQTGWNMVAAPHEATMDSLQVDNGVEVKSLADAQAANWVLATFYGSHDGTGSYSTLTIDQTPPDRLCLWHGYWVLAGIDCSLIVPVAPPAPPTATTAAVRGLACPAWAFDIQASSGSSGDSITIAAADLASDGFDGFALDKPKPPGAPGEGRVRVVLREGWRGTEPPPYNKAPGRQMPWSSELAMETKTAISQPTEYHFTVTGGVKDELVTLSWPELGGLPEDRMATLADRDTGRRTFMRSRAQYAFAAPGPGASRSFAVEVKPAQQGGALISSFSAVPLRGGRGAELRFSLAADATVDVSVLNLAGRLVGRVCENVAVEAGMRTMTWNGRSMNDTALPNGIYLCVLEAKARDGQQARAVRLLALRR